MASMPAALVVTPSGLDITTPATAAAASQTFANKPGLALLVKNANAGTVNATVSVTQTVPNGSGGNLTVSSVAVAIPTGKSYLIGPFPSAVYNNQATQEVTMTLDVFASVTLATVIINPAVS